jgi:hypothetical protein
MQLHHQGGCEFSDSNQLRLLIAVVDIPNAFVQIVVIEEDAEHCVIVHFRGSLVDILCTQCLRSLCIH